MRTGGRQLAAPRPKVRAMTAVALAKRWVRRHAPSAALAHYTSWRVGSPYKEFNDRYKCIFVHVPKAAGLSVVQGLFGIAETDRELNVQPGHRAAWEYRWHDPERFRRYFKFAFVRDPCARLVSAFYFLKAGGINERDRQWAAAFAADCDDVSGFIELLRDPHYRAMALAYDHFQPQSYFICDKRGRILVDFIGRCESFEADFAHVSQSLGVDARCPWANRSDPSKRITLNLEQRQVVQQVYRRDFSLLGYAP